MDIVLKTSGTKHEMRKDSRFQSNKCLREMAEKRAKQTFVIHKVFRIHREPLDSKTMTHRRGMFSVNAMDTGLGTALASH